ncbi:hypothetical protein ES319_D04G111500v1 [Gossypium barbadense]|uniref:Uncharacterized protein n=2 Tax=Gossypium TaxID=3633 RepID=A0A5J5RU78_GOSBA|nr:hypothetical protein ES319_D04G111500v1 [Gossypium barbadense]TYG73656.1 hypothetical protein ES288_D04G119100v1 [Gossypium darwinii]
MIIYTTEVEDINSFYTLKSLKEVYGIIWMLVPILTLVLGITIVLAEGTKLLFKENILPSRGNTRLFSIGPAIALSPYFSRYQYRYFLWIAISSIAPVGLLMSGYRSNNKYSFLGGLRATA